MLRIEPTASTPEIHIQSNLFKMKGVCTPENPPQFFDQFASAVDNFIENTPNPELTFHLDYFNTGSSKCLLNLFKTISREKEKPGMKVIWMYAGGDEEMRESGELYSEIAEMTFDFLEIND